VDEVIVVGVDGSDGAANALEFAAAEAALRETQLRIVSAWEMPDWRYTAPPGFEPVLDPATIDAFRELGKEVADKALATVKERHPSLQVEAISVQGHPADALLAQGADAALIVVGRRGLGGFKSLLLGSVSQQVVHHATCPVVVVG
jgi:nucleotide-binding universal stress UspA family protein